jgi:hypothetical protein
MVHIAIGPMPPVLGGVSFKASLVILHCGHVHHVSAIAKLMSEEFHANEFFFPTTLPSRAMLLA